MPDSSPKPDLPRPVRLAAILIVAYGVLVLFDALWFGFESRFAEIGGLIRAFGRFGLTLLTAWGLCNAQRWAWWFGIIFSGLLAVLGVVTFVLLSIAAALGQQIPFRLLLFPPLLVCFLLSAVVLLLREPSRRFFRKDAEDTGENDRTSRPES